MLPQQQLLQSQEVLDLRMLEVGRPRAVMEAAAPTRVMMREAAAPTRVMMREAAAPTRVMMREAAAPTRVMMREAAAPTRVMMREAAAPTRVMMREAAAPTRVMMREAAPTRAEKGCTLYLPGTFAFVMHIGHKLAHHPLLCLRSNTYGTILLRVLDKSLKMLHMAIVFLGY